MSIESINLLSTETLKAGLTRCCGARRWVDGMLAAFPFESADQLIAKADSIWWGLEPADWREAFTHHPKIGDIENLRQKFAQTADLSTREQAGVSEASEAVLQRLAAGNQAYEARFGYIFIVCATGKSAAEMCTILEARLPNLADDEIRIAAEEQRKITQIRLKQWIGAGE